MSRDPSPSWFFRSLAEAAWADGRIQPEEEALLYEYAVGMGLTRFQAAQILSAVKDAPPSLPYIPFDPLEAEWICNAVVDVACADRTVNVKERAFLYRVLGRFGIEENEIERMVRERLT